MQCKLQLLGDLVLPPDTDVTCFKVSDDGQGVTVVDFSDWILVRTGPAPADTALHPFETPPGDPA